MEGTPTPRRGAPTDKQGTDTYQFIIVGVFIFMDIFMDIQTTTKKNKILTFKHLKF